MTKTILMDPICIIQEEKRRSIKNRLDAKILEAVDESLASFGESVRQFAYFQLQDIYHIKKKEIPSRIEEFAASIEELFGIGAKLIEIKIIETLHAGVPNFLYMPKNKDLMFKDYVQTIRCFLTSVVTI
jgi:hypothetical protein